MTEELDTREKFSIIKRTKSFTHAHRGLWLFVRTTHNAWVHIVVLICTLGLGIFFDIAKIEWVLVVLVSGMVLAAEAFNTAIEIDIDLTSPEYHPYARDTKDVAAGAVLITAITALIVGILIFAPYCIALFMK